MHKSVVHFLSACVLLYVFCMVIQGNAIYIYIYIASNVQFIYSVLID